MIKDVEITAYTKRETVCPQFEELASMFYPFIPGGCINYLLGRRPICLMTGGRCEWGGVPPAKGG